MKRLVLILVVVLLLFGLMMACGLTLDHSSSRASDEPGWMSLLEPLSKKSPVSALDILATPCFVQGDLVARINLPCSIHVRSSEESGVRTIKLVMMSGRSSKIDLQTQGPTGMRVEIPIRAQAPKSPEMQVPKEGADVKIVCEEPGPDVATGGALGQVQLCRLRMSK